MCAKAVVGKFHRVLIAAYLAAEHAATYAYAACEWFNCHQVVLAVALIILGAGVAVAGLKVLEEVL
jgi:hypothetical protein